jgi:cytochrome c peroxidase
MKKLSYFLLFLISFAISCTGGGSRKNADTQPSSEPSLSADAERFLLQDAQDVFQPLPDVANVDYNPVTPEKVLLGKALYHDSRLSKTGNNSCNSCHNLSTFGVDRKPTSPGDAGKNGDRNSPTVLNAALHTMQFWDGRAKDVEEQAGMPILNPVEMAIPSKEFLVNKLKSIPEYKDLFAKAFPNDKAPLNYQNIQNAIAAFERTLLTPSPFDEYLKGKTDALTYKQKVGLREFLNTGCQQCHSGVTLGGNTLQKFAVYGNYWDYTQSQNRDKGRFQHTKNKDDENMFKSCGLRNCAETYPYFHDGSVANLHDAVRIMAKAQLNKDLSEEKVEAIVEFLKSLTGKVPADAAIPPDWVPVVKN